MAFMMNKMKTRRKATVQMNNHVQWHDIIAVRVRNKKLAQILMCHVALHRWTCKIGENVMRILKIDLLTINGTNSFYYLYYLGK